MIKQIKILSSVTIFRKLPVKVKKNDIKLFALDRKKKIQNTYFFFISEILIFKNNFFQGIDKKILFDYLSFQNISSLKLIKKTTLLVLYYLQKWLCIFSLNKNEGKIINKGIIIHNRHSSGYFHWVLDVLPKILYLKRFKDYSIILPINFKGSFQEKSIRMISNIKIKYLNKKKTTIKSCIYASELSASGTPRKEALLGIRKLYLSKIKKLKKIQKIYISRENSSRRKLTNEKQFYEMLKKYKFKKYNMENFSFKKQIKISNSAKIIIGLHGAGLTNSIWMEKGTTIIELKPEKNQYLNCYFSCSDIIRTKYKYFTCKKTNKLLTSRDSNYKVNISEFENEFKKDLLQ